MLAFSSFPLTITRGFIQGPPKKCARTIQGGKTSLYPSCWPTWQNPAHRCYTHGTTTSIEIENYRRKLKWRSMERGMKENELIFRSFIAKYLADMPLALLQEFEQIIDQPDPELYKWLSGAEVAPQHVIKTKMWPLIISHTQDMKHENKTKSSYRTNPKL